MEKVNSPAWIIVGLGNPGKEHELNRHNAGFMCVDALAKKHNIAVNNIEFGALMGLGEIRNQSCLMIKPQTYMNHSGEAVLEYLKNYNMDSTQLIIILDDIYFMPGELRIRKNGGAGGHKGLSSVIENIFTQDFLRIRLGVGQAPEHLSLEDWVVTDFDDNDMAALRKAVEKACSAIEMIIDGDVNYSTINTTSMDYSYTYNDYLLYEKDGKLVKILDDFKNKEAYNDLMNMQ